MQIRDAVATVTGGSAGIGRATAIPLPVRADVIVADVDAKVADDTVSQIRAAGRQGRLVHTDVGSRGLTPLGQFEIFERRRIAERNQNGAATLRRVGTVRSVRLDIPLRTWWI